MKKKIEMGALREFERRLREAEDVEVELRKLDAMEAEAKRSIEEIIEAGKVDDDGAQQQLMRCRLRLDLIPSQRRKARERRAGLEGELSAQCGKLRRAQMETLRAMREAVIEHAMRGLAPLYSDRKLLRRDAENLACEALKRIAKGRARLAFTGAGVEGGRCLINATAATQRELARADVAILPEIAKDFGWEF